MRRISKPGNPKESPNPNHMHSKSKFAVPMVSVTVRKLRNAKPSHTYKKIRDVWSPHPGFYIDPKSKTRHNPEVFFCTNAGRDGQDAAELDICGRGDTRHHIVGVRARPHIFRSSRQNRCVRERE